MNDDLEGSFALCQSTCCDVVTYLHSFTFNPPLGRRMTAADAQLHVARLVL